MEELLSLLNAFFPMRPEIQVAFMSRLQKEVHRKNKLILEAGQVCDWIGFVEKGFLKSSYQAQDGAERILWFHREGDFISSVTSYHQQLPSRIAIRTMEETHIRKIRKIELDAFYERYTEFNINGRKLTEIHTSRFEEQLILMGLPPRKRLSMLAAQHPGLLADNRVKDYMLAGFLGIDKATLSRYRNGRSKVDSDQQLSFFD